MNKPYGSRRSTCYDGGPGSSPATMRPPSSGRIGNKLSTISPTFQATPALAMALMADASDTFKHNPANRHDEVGERASNGYPDHVGLRIAQIIEFTGTGLAQPKKKPPIASVNAGTSNVPIGSMCRIGFSEMRPEHFGGSVTEHACGVAMRSLVQRDRKQ